MGHAWKLLIARITTLHRSETGQVLVLWAFGLLAIIGLAALTIDVGYGYNAKAKAQSAADSAAYAAALAYLLEGSSDTAAAATAYEWAANNGYSNSDADTTVVVNIPPESGPHAGDTFFVEVIIEDQEGTYFADVVGTEFWDIVSRSVATSDTMPKPYSIITLNSNVCEATEIEGNVLITIDGAGTFTQSNCPTNAFHSQGSIIVDTEDNDVVGGWQAGGTVDPPPSSAYPIIDPLGSVPEPLPPTGPVRTCPTYSGPASVVVLEPGVYNCKIDPPGQWGVEFQPGDYLITGGLTVNGGGNVTFGAGVYTFRGDGVELTGNGTITSDEAMLFIEEGAIKLTGTGDMTFNAPEDGTYEGIAIFQARDNTNEVVITGNSVQDGWGTLYAPEAPIDFSGNASTSFQFISDTFYAHGNSVVDIVYQDNHMADVPYIWIAE